MFRGDISNVGSREVWVDQQVFTVKRETSWAVFETVKVEIDSATRDWLWRIGHNIRPVLAWAGELPQEVVDHPAFMTFAEVRLFDCMADLQAAVAAESRVIHYIAVSTDRMFGDKAVLLDRDRSYMPIQTNRRNRDRGRRAKSYIKDRFRGLLGGRGRRRRPKR